MNFKTCALIVAAMSAPSFVLAEGPDRRPGTPTNIPMAEVRQQPTTNLSPHDWMFDYDLYTYEWQLKYKMIVHMGNGQTHVQYYNTISAWEAGYESWYELTGSVDHYNPPASIEGPIAENVKINEEFVERFDTHSQASAVAQSLEQDGEETEIRSVQVNNPSRQQVAEPTGTARQFPQSGGGRRRGRN